PMAISCYPLYSHDASECQPCKRDLTQICSPRGYRKDSSGRPCPDGKRAKPEGGWAMGFAKRLRKPAFIAVMASALMTMPVWAQTSPAPAPPADPFSEIAKLSEEALDSIDDALNAYGNLQDFGDRYGSATRGLLDELIAE